MQSLTPVELCFTPLKLESDADTSLPRNMGNRKPFTASPIKYGTNAISQSD